LRRDKTADAKTDALSKVPRVTLVFWIVKILATTLGETGGDAVDDCKARVRHRQPDLFRVLLRNSRCPDYLQAISCGLLLGLPLRL